MKTNCFPSIAFKIILSDLVESYGEVSKRSPICCKYNVYLTSTIGIVVKMHVMRRIGIVK